MLVATTVVEVGVDVPEATIMVIERAEGFGLAQLHQLRGRVGRGDKASYCLLLYRPPLGETARERLDTLRQTEDGFAIAEADFRLRGPGDLLGVRQAGAVDYRVIDLVRDSDLIEIARSDAGAVIAGDPDLSGDRGRALSLRSGAVSSARSSGRNLIGASPDPPPFRRFWSSQGLRERTSPAETISLAPSSTVMSR